MPTQRRRSRWLTVRALVLCGTTTLSMAAATVAHPAWEARLREIDRKIANAPFEARHYLRRGSLYRDHQQWNEARSDYQKARELGIDSAQADLAEGLLYLQSGQFDKALAPLDRLLLEQPNRSIALRSRATARSSLGMHRDAFADLDRLRVSTERPTPELMLLWAAEAALIGEFDVAIRGLESLSQRLGGLRSIDEALIDMEVTAGRQEAALARTSGLLARSSRSKHLMLCWTLRRAELLEQAGRDGAAQADFQAALDQLESGYPGRRNQRFSELERRALTGLERLNDASKSTRERVPR